MKAGAKDAEKKKIEIDLKLLNCMYYYLEMW